MECLRIEIRLNVADLDAGLCYILAAPLTERKHELEQLFLHAGTDRGHHSQIEQRDPPVIREKDGPIGL